MADTVISTEVVIAGFVALGGAIVWLAHKWDAGNTRCEERSNLLHRELGSLRDWTQSKMLEALQENTKALRRLKYEVRELDPTDTAHNDSESGLYPVSETGVELHPPVRRSWVETTEVMRKVK
jgi:hypothetical protein